MKSSQLTIAFKDLGAACRFALLHMDKGPKRNAILGLPPEHPMDWLESVEAIASSDKDAMQEARTIYNELVN